MEIILIIIFNQVLRAVKLASISIESIPWQLHSREFFLKTLVHTRVIDVVLGVARIYIDLYRPDDSDDSL